jgi:SAM-dependent methyltransferase
LLSAVGAQNLREVNDFRLTDASLVADIASARDRFGDRAAVLVETTLLRRKAAAKLADPSDWLFTDEALQQATAEPVAAHRANRLAGVAVHDATCSIGTELAALRNSAAYVIGSDIDPIRLAMAAHNVADVDLCRADALRPVTHDTVVLVDPARRSGGRRRFDPRDYTPAVNTLLDVYLGRDLVVKCAPGIDFDELFRLGFRGEIEVTSLAGSVREACLWSAGLAGEGVSRRATMLGIGEVVTDADPDDSVVAPAGRWIVDPDGAVVRAGLVRHYAARHGLWQLDPDIAYLSGDRLPEKVRGFEVFEELNYSERRLRQALSARDVGAVEILVRGVDIDPDTLRARLRLRGSQPAAVVIARIGTGAASRATAFICRPSR